MGKGKSLEFTKGTQLVWAGGAELVALTVHKTASQYAVTCFV